MEESTENAVQDVEYYSREKYGAANLFAAKKTVAQVHRLFLLYNELRMHCDYLKTEESMIKISCPLVCQDPHRSNRKDCFCEDLIRKDKYGTDILSSSVTRILRVNNVEVALKCKNTVKEEFFHVLREFGQPGKLEGMMDVALITANANQLRFIVEYNQSSPTYVIAITLIAVSLILQIVVGICLIFKGRCDLKGEKKFQQANAINNYIVVGVFFITIVNVFVAAFSTGPPPLNKPE